MVKYRKSLIVVFVFIQFPILLKTLKYTQIVFLKFTNPNNIKC